MVSFPNGYCSCFITATDPDGLTPESMSYCNQADSCMSELVKEIKHFFARLF